MIALFRRALAVAEPGTRRRLLAAIPASVAIALLELIGFGLIVPFLTLLVDPGSIDEGGWVSSVRDMSGVTSDQQFVALLGGLIIGSLLLRSACAAILLYWQLGVLSRGEAATATRLFDAYMRAPYTFHLERNSAGLVRHVEGSTGLLYQKVLLGFIQLVSEVFVAVAIVGVLVVIEPVVAVLTGIYLGLVGLAYSRGLSNVTRRVGRENQVFAKENHKRLVEGLGGLKVFQVLGGEARVSQVFGDGRMRWASNRRLALFLNQTSRYFLEAAVLVGILVLSVVVVSVRSGDEALGVLGVLVAGAFRMLPSLNRMLVALNNAQLGAAAVDDLASEQQLLTSLAPLPGEAVSIPFEQSFTLDHVSFTYPAADAEVIRDMDLTVQRGESVGLVGASGAGKSTLVDILLGLLSPQSGCLRVDGQAIGPDEVASWRAKVGLVPQEVFLIDDSLRANVALGAEHPDDARVDEVLGLAQLQDFVAALPEGLDTWVGERGVRLSGGQRQRLGIARALYREPEVLILDEATSALDTTTEASISRTIQALHGKLTLIVIAHRLSTVRRCDRIVFLKHGAIEGVGDFDELQVRNREFAELVRLSSLAADTNGHQPAGAAS